MAPPLAGGGVGVAAAAAPPLLCLYAAHPMAATAVRIIAPYTASFPSFLTCASNSAWNSRASSLSGCSCMACWRLRRALTIQPCLAYVLASVR